VFHCPLFEAEPTFFPQIKTSFLKGKVRGYSLSKEARVPPLRVLFLHLVLFPPFQNEGIGLPRWCIYSFSSQCFFPPLDENTIGVPQRCGWLPFFPPHSSFLFFFQKGGCVSFFLKRRFLPELPLRHPPLRTKLWASFLLCDKHETIPLRVQTIKTSPLFLFFSPLLQPFFFSFPL